MLISLNWLKDLVKIPGRLNAVDLARELTLKTVEVEGIVKAGERFNNVIIGQILEIQKHPQADRLQIAIVDIGSAKLTIVCGAPNIAVGQLVPVALVGAVLPNGLEIKEAEIRGQKSSGMLCAPDELGLGSSHDGILIIKKGKIGENLADNLKINDTILEIDNKSMSHRPDLFGHLGIAREISAIFNAPLKNFSASEIKLTPNTKTPEKLSIKISDSKLCPRYSALKISNLKISESPDWLKERLLAVGQKPINNIVDITNYVMLELGQPLHAFDAKDIKKIEVRLSQASETIKTLDGQDLKLKGGELLITDGQNPIALAGIMGGADSAIKPETNSIIIESANFNSALIRRSSQDLNLRTEASVRFEKSLDPENTLKALQLAVSLIKKINKNAEINSELGDYYPNPIKNREINLSLSWANNLIGLEIPAKKIKEYLSGLGLVITKEDEENISCLIPSYRGHDLVLAEDLVEEILRLYGFDNINSKLPIMELQAPNINQELNLENKIKDYLVLAANLNEVYNYSFLSEEDIVKAGVNPENNLKINSPLSKNYEYLRPNLSIGLINNLKNNQYKYNSFGLFEIGNVFSANIGLLDKNGGNEKLPYQENRLGILIAGTDKLKTFKDLKTITSGLILRLVNNQAEITFEAIDQTATAKIIVKNQEIGYLSLIDQKTTDNFSLKKSGAIVEIRLNKLLETVLEAGEIRYDRLTKFPPVIRDLAFVLDKRISYGQFYKELKNFDSLISRADLFDVYEGQNLAANQKSLAFHVVYQSPGKTLTSEEVDEVQKKLLTHLYQKFEAVLRDF